LQSQSAAASAFLDSLDAQSSAPRREPPAPRSSLLHRAIQQYLVRYQCRCLWQVRHQWLQLGQPPSVASTTDPPLDSMTAPSAAAAAVRDTVAGHTAHRLSDAPTWTGVCVGCRSWCMSCLWSTCASITITPRPKQRPCHRRRPRRRRLLCRVLTCRPRAEAGTGVFMYMHGACTCICIRARACTCRGSTCAYTCAHGRGV